MDIQAYKTAFEHWRSDRETPGVTRYYLDAYLQNLGAPPILREARAHAALYAQVPVVLIPGLDLAGLLSFREPVGFAYGCGTYVNEDHARALAGTYPRIWDDIAQVKPYLMDINDPALFNEAERLSIECGAATSTWFNGHIVLDFERVLAIGLDGYAAEIEKAAAHSERVDFYEALRVMLAAVQHLIKRFADSCDGTLSETLRAVAHKPPQTLHQALQLLWMLHMLNGADSIGRLDTYLEPFYQADLAAGRVDEQRAEALIANLIILVEADGAIQNLTLGGTDADGQDCCGGLTRIILRVTRLLHYKGPNLCLRVTPHTPADVWDEALALMAEGMGLPALYNDGLYADSLIRSGVPVETARGYCFAGCSQLSLPGISNFVNDIGIYNAAKVCELAMYGGFDPRTGKQVGPRTREATHCETFAELMEAFYTQLDHFADIEVRLHNKLVPKRASLDGFALRTLFTRDCIGNGQAVFEGGARYNHIELEIIGLTNTADHLYAVKKAVFDEKRYTMTELTAALRANFKGFEAMRTYLYDRVDKFGNDIEEVDALRAAITHRLYARFNGSQACLGGVFVPGEVIFVAHEYCGWLVGALADGRRAGTVLADSAGSSQGRDINGVTALMNSVLRIPAAEYLLTSVVLNLRFLPSLFRQPHTVQTVRALFEGFFAQGGAQLQVNVCDAETLRAAQAQPAQYQSLTVRVGGYCDYFVRLSRAIQDEIIQRTEQCI